METTKRPWRVVKHRDGAIRYQDIAGGNRGVGWFMNDGDAHLTVKAVNLHGDAVELAYLVEKTHDCEEPENPHCQCLHCKAAAILAKAQ